MDTSHQIPQGSVLVLIHGRIFTTVKLGPYLGSLRTDHFALDHT